MRTDSGMRAVAIAALMGWALGCGGGGKKSGGDGGVEHVALNVNESNVRYVAGVGARIVDTFPPVSDLLDAAFTALSEPGAVRTGQPVPLSACTSGGATLVWTDANGDGSLSSGDTVALSSTSCRVHAGDGETLAGTITASVTSVVPGPPLQVGGTAVLELALAGAAPGTLRGGVAFTATEVDRGGIFHDFIYRPAGTSLLAATGGTPWEFACYEVLNDYNPAPGAWRWIALTGVVRVPANQVMSFSPGARLRYGANDQPTGPDRMTLLSFMDDPSCPALGIADGVGGSDGSTLDLFPNSAAGEIGLELHRAGRSTSTSYSWWDVLHPSPPATGIINGANAVAMASAAVMSLALPQDVGALVTELVLGAYRGAPFALCSSGSYAVTPRPALVADEALTVTFSSCTTAALGVPVTIGGSARVTVLAVGGAPATDTYTLATSVGPIDVTSSDDLGTARVTGSFRFSRAATAQGMSEHSEAIPGATLAIGETGGASERRSTSFAVNSVKPFAGPYTVASTGDAMTVVTAAGELTVTVVAAVQGAEDGPPSSGTIRIGARDGTSLTLTVGAAGAVALGLDANGDGTVDATIASTWEELQ